MGGKRFIVLVVLLAITHLGMNQQQQQSQQKPEQQLQRPLLYDKFNINEGCVASNPEIWSVISWYFDRCILIMINIITDSDNRPRTYDFATSFVRNLIDNTGIPATIVQQPSNYEGDPIGKADNYSWQGELFEPRPGQVNNATMRKKRQVSEILKEHIRTDEPRQGIVIIVKGISVIDKYLVGTARSPFRTPSNNYIIILRTVEDGWRHKAELILRRMWNDYGIGNCILMAPCLDSGEHEFASYYPYSVDSSISEPTARDYGSVTWTNIRDTSFTNKFFKKLGHMNGYPFRVSIFQRYPTALLPTEMTPTSRNSVYSTAIAYSGGFGGFDGIVLGNMAKKLNFTTVVVQPKISDFGYVDRNGLYVGSLGDVLHSKAFISMNGRFVADYGTTEVDFLYPVNFDHFCIIAPKSLKVPQWMAIFKCFDEHLWIAIIVVNLFCCYFWWMLRKCKRTLFTESESYIGNRQLKTKHKFAHVTLEMFLIMLSAPTIYMPKKTNERIFMAACLLPTVIIIGVFQGTLTTSYSTTTFYKDIETLAELDASGLPIGTTSVSLIDIFGSGDTPLLKSLVSKFSLYKTGGPIITRTAYHRDICCIERCSDLKVIISKSYQLPDGNVLLHAIPESPKYCQIAYIVRKGWPWTAIFNNLIHRFHQAGLLNKWYSDTEDSIIRYENIENRKYSVPIRVLTLVDLQTAFFILTIGVICSGIVLCIEIYLHKRQKHIKETVEDTFYVN